MIIGIVNAYLNKIMSISSSVTSMHTCRWLYDCKNNTIMRMCSFYLNYNEHRWFFTFKYHRPDVYENRKMMITFLPLDCLLMYIFEYVIFFMYFLFLSIFQSKSGDFFWWKNYDCGLWLLDCWIWVACRCKKLENI